MKLASLLIATILCGSAYAGNHEETASNAANAKLFFEAFLAGEQVPAKRLIHDDFTFVYKGRTRISNQVQDKDSYFGGYWASLSRELLPDGFTKFEFLRSVAEKDRVVWFAEGDAEGINGRYDNEYVFVFEFSEGKILSIAEYNSDLMVATRLYRQKLVPDD